MPRSMALLQPWSVVMSVALDTSEGQEDKAVQSWPCLSLAAKLGRTGPAPHWLKHSGEQVLHNRADPVDRGEGELDLREWECES